MKNVLKYSVCGLLSVCLLGSCNDSKFLEEDPETFYTIDMSSLLLNRLIKCWSAVIPMYVL